MPSTAQALRMTWQGVQSGAAPGKAVWARALAALGAALVATLLAGLTSLAAAGPVADRVRASGEVRVCIWPDYYGITLRHPRTGQLVGLDIDLAQELARDLNVRLQFVDSSFPTLIDDLRKDRCDVAMFAVGILPARQQALSFTRPYLASDIYAITMRSSKTVRRWEDIDQPGVAVAVQAGTFMEPVMTAALKQAKVVKVAPPQTRERELEAGRVDDFMTDYAYSRRLLDNADWALLLSPPQPFHVLPYGYPVKPGDAQWLATMDEFVARIQRDGRLRAAAQKHGLMPIVRLQ